MQQLNEILYLNKCEYLFKIEWSESEFFTSNNFFLSIIYNLDINGDVYKLDVDCEILLLIR